MSTLKPASSQSIESYVSEIPAADPEAARRHFAAKLSVECDAWDVFNDRNKNVTSFVLVDARGPDAYAEEHIPGAIHFWHREMNSETVQRLPKEKVIVLYCKGVGCNAAPKGAMKLSALGFRVKEMVGGLEWWKEKFGYPTEKR